MTKKAAVIGSGIAGLAAAIRLANKGYVVEVFEKNSIAGGKISQIKLNGYRFDTGPSLFTLPELVEELFALCNKNISDYLKFQRLENVCKYFFPDGTIVNAFSDPEKFAAELKNKTNEDESHLTKYLKKCKELYEFTSDIFIFNSLHKLNNYFKRSCFLALLKSYKLDSLKTLHQRNSKDFQQEKVIQLFDRYATYNGSDPYQAPATLKVISHLEHNCGAFFPENGMYCIVESLEKLAKETGVQFHYNSPVDEILIEENKVKSIKVSGKELFFDVVVSDSDITNTYKNLLPKFRMPSHVKKNEPSSSALIFYWCVKKSFPQLELHNILFSGNYKEEFDYLFRKHSICDDPTVYIFISAKLAKQDAPSDCENWFVMINVPSDNGQNWDDLVSKAHRDIIKTINATLQIDIEPLIEYETMTDPKSIEKNTSSYRGALYGSSSNNMMAAFNRHANFKRQFKNLYFVGGSVHPGGGIPLCLASSAIVDKEIESVE